MKRMAVWAIGLSLILATGFVDKDGDSYSLRKPRYAIAHRAGVLIVEGSQTVRDWTIMTYSVDDILDHTGDIPSTEPSWRPIINGKV